VRTYVRALEQPNPGGRRQRRLPGYRDEAVVRRFDAPEALETNFYEVRAKSVLNRVPGKSQMPFRWTINPYRGCSDACVYCSWGGTPILMADGQHRKLADLEVGDAIYGHGPARAISTLCARTTVLAKWTSVRSALQGDARERHRTNHEQQSSLPHEPGVKHVIGAEQGPLQRPHLTTGVSMVGTGPFVSPACRDARVPARLPVWPYPRGDGHLGSYPYTRPGRAIGEVHRFPPGPGRRRGTTSCQ